MQPKQDREWPLVFFTLLTQMAVGVFTISGLVAVVLPAPNLFSTELLAKMVLGFTLAIFVAGVVAATLHLGRPIGALFSLRNLRSSWLSREALLAGGFGLLVLVLLLRRWRAIDFSEADEIITLAAVGCGLGLIFVIARLYMLRTVPAWNHLGTPASFYTSSSLLGAVGIVMLWLAAIYWEDAYASNQVLVPVLTVSDLLISLLVVIQLSVFVFTIINLNGAGGKAAESARLLWTELRWITFCRWLTAFAGVGLLLWRRVLWGSVFSLLASALLILISEVLGRYLFYGFYRRVGF